MRASILLCLAGAATALALFVFRAPAEEPAEAVVTQPSSLAFVAAPSAPLSLPPAVAPQEAPTMEELFAPERRVAEALDADLRSQGVDGRWSADTLAAIDDSLLLPEAEGIALTSAECRERSCKVGLSANSPAGRDAWLEVLAFTPPYNTRGFIRMDGPEDLDFEVYFAREGELLPIPEG